MKNWKTSLCGILSFVVQFGHAIPALSPYCNALSMIAVAAGLHLAQDGK